ncbi:protein SAAL1 [Sceloporus undulatus]|uniref:protein SAAL1 n=1 Tax=Sceloporus undulatus TaxID=8520 RepID=UPI001C4CB225|nr:protein SAAL1 [Sceloporus undulatus]XP_042300778.1 protein SAAL1 [Sceloporus undulatus]XP_042300779.1 protein SAAL1 [Sceloporus undulatus]
MDRNPSPPSSDSEEEAVVAGDSIGNTVYSKHWLFSVLTKLIEFLTPQKDDASELNNVEEEVELEEDMENVICKVWDMSMDKDVALFLQEFNAPDIFMGVFAKSKCPRLTEICVGILGNMACCQEVCMSISNDENLGQMVLQRLCDSDSPTLLETSRLLLTCLCQSEVADIWVKRIRENPLVYDCTCFIMSSSTNVELLVKIGEVVDKLFDLDEELMLDWIKKGSQWSVTQPVDDSSNEHQVIKIVPCLLEATKQIRSEKHSEGLDVYMHILQLLTTVDEGIQAIVQSPDSGKETWSLLCDLFCSEICQPDDPSIIVQEQKTVLASILSVLSAIFSSQTKQEFVKIQKNMPLIDSLIRVLRNMDECVKRSGVNLNKSKSEEPEKLGIAEEDCHLKIVKDICCELLSTMLLEMSKENILEGLKQGHLNEEKCSCVFQNLLPEYLSSVKSFLVVLHEVDHTLADSLENNFPSLKLQT